MSLILHNYNDYDPDRIERDRFIKNEENPRGSNNAWTRPYYDGSIAICYGFDILVRDSREIKSYLDKANDAMGLTGSGRVTLSSRDASLLVSTRGGTATQIRQVARSLSLAFPSEAYSAKLLNIMLNEFESALDNALGFCMAPSKEKTAVLSLLYSITRPKATAVKAEIPSTLNAIKNNNRAEAWYELRYRSNKDL